MPSLTLTTTTPASARDQPPSNPRSTTFTKASGSVSGTFQLHDKLTITTIAGSINITLILGPASPTSPRTIPELTLSSSTGNITVQTLLPPSTPLHSVPDRQYVIMVKTRSGNILATLPHARKTSIHSVSGNISASLHPLGPTSSVSAIDVRNASGSTQIALHAHLKTPSAPLRMLTGEYYGTTGSLNILYPLTWEGEVESRMSKGMVQHQWPGMKVVRSGPRFKATVGDGGLVGGLYVVGKGMGVNLMGMDLSAEVEREVEGDEQMGGGSSLQEWRERWGSFSSGAGGDTRPPSYVGFPPSYAECVEEGMVQGGQGGGEG